MIDITMPRLSDTMEEGAIAVWHKQPGDKVSVGDILVEIETDKATMEYEAYDAGTLAEILVNVGETVTIGTPIARLDDGKGTGPTPVASTPAASTAAAVKTEAVTAPVVAPEPQSQPSAPNQPEAIDGERQFVSPLVRRLAREHQLDLSGVTGTGPGGRIIRTDIEDLLKPGASAKSVPAIASAPRVTPSVPVGTPTGDEKRGSKAIPMSNARRVIARRLGESARSIPHFYVTAVADAEALVQLRAQINARFAELGREKVSLNDLLIRACALALREHPLVNASYVDDESRTMLVHDRINIGMAVASDNGLVVPVIPDADLKSISEIGEEAKYLASLASGKGLTIDQMSGGTFTISNLGMFGVEQFTAIINPPEAAILAVGGTALEPVALNGEIVLHHRMRYTLSADHRVIDGALAATFLQSLTRLIENPVAIVLA
jgi:pyruvate dehydrogenase E2 component (dihydrolipoamide acetyltransferase)